MDAVPGTRTHPDFMRSPVGQLRSFATTPKTRNPAELSLRNSALGRDAKNAFDSFQPKAPKLSLSHYGGKQLGKKNNQELGLDAILKMILGGRFS